jgi:RNA polymerase sigma-70 factor (ECF subfamily)
MSTAMDFPGAPEEAESISDPATWFDEAVPRLYGYFIVRVGGRVDVAEDLTQETIVAAVNNPAPPNRSTPILAWLFGIARHKLVDHYRREERERRQFEFHVDPAIIEIGPSPPLGELDLDSIHTRDDIIATVDRLSPRQRSAIVLRYFDDRDVVTTAAVLGLSVHATESLLARGRIAFRRIYREITGEQP